MIKIEKTVWETWVYRWKNADDDDDMVTHRIEDWMMNEYDMDYFNDVKELESLSKSVKEIEESDAAACFYKCNIIPVMNSLRASVDEMETLCSSEHWCYPSYGDLLFSVR